jgi:hypothetical protein
MSVLALRELIDSQEKRIEKLLVQRGVLLFFVVMTSAACVALWLMLG